MEDREKKSVKIRFTNILTRVSIIYFLYWFIKILYKNHG